MIFPGKWPVYSCYSHFKGGTSRSAIACDLPPNLRIHRLNDLGGTVKRGIVIIAVHAIWASSFFYDLPS
jgi:hypothetical protein